MGILLPNCTHYVLGLLGAMEAGLTVTTLNPAYTMPEIARQLEMSDAKIILTDKTRLQPVQEALKKIGMNENDINSNARQLSSAPAQNKGDEVSIMRSSC